MKTTYINQLPEAFIERIYVEVQKKNPRGCREEYQDAMDGRLCDIESFINVTALLQEVEVWKKLGREIGHFEYGDLIWDEGGKVLMVTLKSDNTNKISLEDVQEFYRSGYIQKICIDEEVHTFFETQQ